MTKTRARRGSGRVTHPDRYALYEVAVQGVDWDLDFLERAWRRRNRGPEPRFFREDFCSTAALASAWVRRGRGREAFAVDLDPQPLAWARAHRLPYLREAARRVHLVRSDVRRVQRPAVDIACALNFSWWVFHDRAELIRYLAAARAGLRRGGILVLNMFGGVRAERPLVERTRKRAENGPDGRMLPPFTYVWEHASFNAVDRRLVAHISFELPNDRRMRRAFTYDWRMYTLPEVRDAALAAGFRDCEVWSEGWNAKRRQGNGTLYERVRLDNEDTWIAYVVLR